MTIKDVKNFFGKEKYISEFIRYQLKIETHRGGIVWHVVRYAKLIFAGGLCFAWYTGCIQRSCCFDHTQLIFALYLL